MNSSTIPILVALFVQLALGLVVFQANRQLKSNQSFLLLSVVAAGWLCSLYYASTATAADAAAFWIREASAFGALNLAGFNLLRLSIREKQRSWKEILRQSRVWLVATFAIVIFCQTKLFLQGARLPHGLASTAPEPVYGYPGVYIYAFYFGAAILALVIAALRDLRTASGAVRAE